MFKTFKLGAAIFILYSTGMCTAQSATGANSARPAELKHFRLTFVLSDPQGGQATQTIQLDVPVAAGRPGMTGFNSASGTVGQVEGSVAQSMEVTNVRESATGLAASVSFSADTITKADSGEPLHHNRVIHKEIDVVLATPTQLTDEGHLVPLGDAAKAGAVAMPALKMTVTVTRI